MLERMNRQATTQALAAVGAMLIWAALFGQFVLLRGVIAGQGGSIAAAIWRFLGFFTILTNILVACALTHAALWPQRRYGLGLPVFEAMVVVSIILVGLVYSAVLRALWKPMGAQKWVDAGLHDLAPVLALVFWLLRPHGRLRWRQMPWLLSWPLLYCVYALSRGAADGWYPYPFLDAAKLSPAYLILNIIVLIAAFAAVSVALIAVDRWLGQPRRRVP
jgi:hypothetical protein